MTQYLPDIIQLQHILYKVYNYKVDEEELSKMTIKDLQENKGSHAVISVWSLYNSSKYVQILKH